MEEESKLKANYSLGEKKKKKLFPEGVIHHAGVFIENYLKLRYTPHLKRVLSGGTKVSGRHFPQDDISICVDFFGG